MVQLDVDRLSAQLEQLGVQRRGQRGGPPPAAVDTGHPSLQQVSTPGMLFLLSRRGLLVVRMKGSTELSKPTSLPHLTGRCCTSLRVYLKAPARLTSPGSHLMTSIVTSSLEVGLITDSK